MGIIESIIEKGYISKPYVGLSVSTVSIDAQQFGIPKGAAVQAVAADSPAQAAGLQAGDVITHVNDQEIIGSTELVSMVGKAQIGDVLTMTVYRKGEILTLTVTVGEQIQSAKQEQSQQSGMQRLPGRP